MKTLFVNQKINYTGEQLKPLTNYLVHGQMGSSVVAWLGPCSVATEHMIDGEDLRAQETIAADEMLHFVFELFDFDLRAGVVLQRLLAEMTSRLLREISRDPRAQKITRQGDDLYFEKQKLNISIATVSRTSCLIHFAINHKASGAPVAILSLQDLKVDGVDFAHKMLTLIQQEMDDIFAASYKVRTF